MRTQRKIEKLLKDVRSCFARRHAKTGFPFNATVRSDIASIREARLRLERSFDFLAYAKTLEGEELREPPIGGEFGHYEGVADIYKVNMTRLLGKESPELSLEQYDKITVLLNEDVEFQAEFINSLSEHGVLDRVGYVCEVEGYHYI